MKGKGDFHDKSDITGSSENMKKHLQKEFKRKIDLSSICPHVPDG